ncbi:MAG: ATPase AAA [Candidatus Dormibacteraceae bacterium]
MAVVGGSGGGKTTISLAIGAALNLPVIHLDAEYWQPGWVGSSRERWQAHFSDLAARPRWVMDGTYGSTTAAELAAADLVIDVEVSRLLSLYRVVRRSLRWRGRTRPDLAAGCPERLRWEFVAFVWRFPRRGRPALDAAIAAAGVPVIRLRSRVEARRFLAGLPATLGV